MLAAAPPARKTGIVAKRSRTRVSPRSRDNSAWSHRVDVCAAYYVVAEAFTIVAEHRHASNLGCHQPHLRCNDGQTVAVEQRFPGELETLRADNVRLRRVLN